MKRHGLRILAAILSIVALTNPARATTNLFTPVSGAAFTPYGGQVGYNTLVFVNGVMYNTSSSAFTVNASLGHAQGGSNAFTFVVLTNWGTTTCTVLGTYDATGSQGVVTNWASTQGQLSGLPGYVVPVTVNTNFPSGGQTYSAQCTLGGYDGNSAGIVGVYPSN
jgi:hypothetical protein